MITCSVVVTPNSTAGISIPQPRVHRIRLAMPPDAMRQHTVEETRTLHLSNSPPTATLANTLTSITTEYIRAAAAAVRPVPVQ